MLNHGKWMTVMVIGALLCLAGEGRGQPLPSAAGFRPVLVISR